VDTSPFSHPPTGLIRTHLWPTLGDLLLLLLAVLPLLLAPAVLWSCRLLLLAAALLLSRCQEQQPEPAAPVQLQWSAVDHFQLQLQVLLGVQLQQVSSV
jgi:hypothetical protein